VKRSDIKARTGLNNLGLALALVIAGLLGAASAQSARADEWNQETILTFSQPVEIPGQILPAGRYWFILADSFSNRHIVRIFSSDWSKLYATLNIVRNQREKLQSGLPSGRRISPRQLPLGFILVKSQDTSLFTGAKKQVNLPQPARSSS
jgi:hypothetical protein